MRTAHSLVSLLWAATVSAQVFVVDANNGTGTNFTDLPTAVAGVPDGSTLIVRTGVYAGFTLTGRGLRLLSEGTVRLQSPGITISATLPNQAVLLRGLTFDAPFGISTNIVLQGCQGPVILEGVRDGSPFTPGMTATIQTCDNVWFHECSLLPPSAPSLFQPAVPPPRIAVADSTVVVSRPSVQGVKGRDAAVGLQAQPGSAGIELLRSTCLVIESTVRGGAGGLGCLSCGIGCAANGASGGPGCRVNTGSSLSVFGGQVAGGTGGGPGCCQTSGQCTASGAGGPGLDLLAGVTELLGTTLLGGSFTGAGATLTIDGSALPSSAWLTGTQQVGNSVMFELHAAPQSLALLFYTYQQGLVSFAPFLHGLVLSEPLFVLGLFAADASGGLQIPVTLPPALQLGQIHSAQFFTLDPATGALWATNAFPITVGR